MKRGKERPKRLAGEKIVNSGEKYSISEKRFKVLQEKVIL